MEEFLQVVVLVAVVRPAAELVPTQRQEVIHRTMADRLQAVSPILLTCKIFLIIGFVETLIEKVFCFMNKDTVFIVWWIISERKWMAAITPVLWDTPKTLGIAAMTFWWNPVNWLMFCKAKPIYSSIIANFTIPSVFERDHWKLQTVPEPCWQRGYHKRRCACNQVDDVDKPRTLAAHHEHLVIFCSQLTYVHKIKFGAQLFAFALSV